MTEKAKGKDDKCETGFRTINKQTWKNRFISMVGMKTTDYNEFDKKKDQEHEKMKKWYDLNKLKRYGDI